MAKLKHLAAILVFFLALLSACQDVPAVAVSTATSAPTDTPEPTNTPEPTATPTVTNTPTATPTPTNTPTPTPVMLTADELSAVMLTLDDFQPGFTVDSNRTGPVTRELLLEREAEITVGYLDEAGDWTSYEATFQRESLPDYTTVQSWAIAFDSDAQAADYVENITMFFSPDLEHERVSFERLGEQREAFKTTVEQTTYTFDVHYIVFRRRNIVIALRYITFEGLTEIGALTEYGRVLDERLQQAVGDGTEE